VKKEIVSEPLSEDELACLRMLDAKATPPPWRAGDWNQEAGGVMLSYTHADGEERPLLYYNGQDTAFAHDHANCALTAALRNALPAILAALAERDAVIHDMMQDGGYSAGRQSAGAPAYQPGPPPEQARARADMLQSENARLRQALEEIATGSIGRGRGALTRLAREALGLKSFPHEGARDDH
jgi:hypothetical protein